MKAVSLALAIIAFIALELLKSGAKLAYALPSYELLALAALAGFFVATGLVLTRDTRRCVISLAVFSGYVIARALLSPVEYVARVDLFMLLATLILYLLFVLGFTSSRSRSIFVILLLVLVAANCAIGARQFLGGDNFMPFARLWRGDYGNRASGFYGCPNHLAGFLEMVLFLCLGLALWSEWRVGWRILAGYFALMCVAVILISGSRGGYLSTLLGLAVFGVVSFILVGQRFTLHPILQWIIALAVMLCLAGGVYAFGKRSELVNFRVQTASADGQVRLQMSRAALRQFQDSPLVGAGSATYLYYGRKYREPGMSLDTTWAHNDAFQFLAEFGLLGALSFAAFLGAHLYSGWKAIAGAVSGRSATWLSGSNSLAMSLGALSGVAAICVHSFVDFNLHMPVNALLLAFLLALLANPTDADPLPVQDASRSPRFESIARWSLPALGLWLLVAGVPILPAEYYGERSRELLTNGSTMESADAAREAETFARKAREWDRSNPYLHYFLGEALVARTAFLPEGQERDRLYLESIDAYKRAAELTPMDASLYLFIGGSYDGLRRFDDAEQYYRQALSLDPNFGPVHWSYASHFHIQGKFDAAEAEYAKAGELKIGDAAGLAIQRLTLERNAKALSPADPARQAP